MPSLRETMKRTTQAQLDGYRKWNVEAIVAPRADDCIYTYHPESMGRPPMNNDQFKDWFSTMIPLLKDFDVRHDIFGSRLRRSCLSSMLTEVGDCRP